MKEFVLKKSLPYVENIFNGEKLLAIVLRTEFMREGIEFFTPDDFSQAARPRESGQCPGALGDAPGKLWGKLWGDSREILGTPRGQALERFWGKLW